MFTLADIDDDLIKIIAIAGVFILLLASLIVYGITTVAQSRHREETRREAAASTSPRVP